MSELNEDKVTVDREVVQRLIDSTLEHDAPLRHVQDALDYIIARRQIGNPLVRSGEQLPRYMYDGRFEPGHQYDLYTEETRNLMYRLTQVLEKGERAQSDIREEDLPPIEELHTQEYDVTYVQRVDEKATVTVEASSKEEAIQKAKKGDFKGEMDTTFVNWVHDSFKDPKVELAGKENDSENWRVETAAKIEFLEDQFNFIETAVTEYEDGVTHVEILPDRFVEQARFSVDDEQFRPEIVAEVREQPPVIVDEEIRFYRNDQAGQHVGELVVPDSLQPLLRSYLDQLEDVLEEAIGGFEIDNQAINL